MNLRINGAIRLAGLVISLLLFSALLQAFPHLSAAQVREERKETLFSQSLSEQRIISVSLPGEYTAVSGDYPVLFVLDAESRKIWRECISTVESLHAHGKAPQMILVGVWNTDRSRDMIPAAVAHRPGSGGSLRFLDFLSKELIPHIRQTYNALDSFMLYGGSNAGLFTVYALLERPEAFRAYIASSPMIGHCPDFMQKKAEGFVLRKRMDERTLYMVYGDQDSDRVTEFVPAFQDFMESKVLGAFRSRLDILKGEGHVPASSLSRGISYIFTRADNLHAAGKTPR